MTKKIEMVVFDWAGTTVDYGSMAPVDTFKKVFEDEGLELSKDQINGPMGLDKKTHIRMLLEDPDIGQAWQEVKGSPWTGEDVDRIYQNFEGSLAQIVAEYSVPIKGLVETVTCLRDRGIKIGSTTGYSSDMMENVKYKAAEMGYEPDCIITPDISGQGRPSPYMIFEAMKTLDVYSVDTVIKVGDTVSDIEEGVNSGVWTVGVLVGSNLLGLNEDEYAAMDSNDLDRLKSQTSKKYYMAGADYVIHDIRDLCDLVDIINKRLGLNQNKGY